MTQGPLVVPYKLGRKHNNLEKQSDKTRNKMCWQGLVLYKAMPKASTELIVGGVRFKG